MKLWEVLKTLEEHPKKAYELKDVGGRTWTITTGYDDDYPELEVYYMIECSTDGDIHGNISPSDNGWQPVRQPVTWQEAIQAWMEGNRVTVEYELFGGIVKHGKPPFGENISVNRNELIQGTWYVED